MEKLIEITKFKITIFMGILAGAGFLSINCDKIAKNLGFNSNLLVWIVIYIFITYGISGFLINLKTLSSLQNKLKEEKC